MNTIIATSVSSKNDKGNRSVMAKVLGSGTAGLSEMIIFHPVDTIAKRLMTFESNIIAKPGESTLGNLNKAVFQKQADATILKRYGSLFPGIGYGAGYKVLQRVYKFGGQPFVNSFFVKNFSSQFSAIFGERHAKTVMYAFAGSLMGIGEIVLLPLDVLKIKAQTNPESFKGRGPLKIFAEEGLNLYKGCYK
jgi:hypothetical protein